MTTTEKEIILPVDREAIRAELKPEYFLRSTNNADNEIYIIEAPSCPAVMREIGRLREVSFRLAGGGTGEELDIDDFDSARPPYKQLVVWDPQGNEIIGGYRYMLCGDADLDDKGMPRLATSKLFHFSPQFISDFLPYTIELGRSFVQPAYQPSKENRKSIFSLDNLWDGLGALTVDHPEIRYFFGKVTMYSHFNAYARDLILFFMNRFFPDTDKLVWPILPLHMQTPAEKLENIFDCDTFEGNYRLLMKHVREQNENIPPLFSSYMKISATMRTFGTALNDHFGGVEETGIMVTISDIYEAKKQRHISTYRDEPLGINFK